MLQFACEARVRVSGSVNHFPNFVIGAVGGPLKILKTKVWVRIRSTNNSTVLDFSKKLYKILFCFFCFSDKKIMPKVTIWASKCSLQSPKCRSKTNILENTLNYIINPLKMFLVLNLNKLKIYKYNNGQIRCDSNHCQKLRKVH